MRRCRSILALCLLTAAVLTPLAAEDLILTIMDRDLDYPMEGASVRLVGDENSLLAGPDGKVTLPLPGGEGRKVLLVTYPGYETIRLPLKGEETSLLVEMTLSGIIEGEELVVERTAPGVKEETAGISVAMDREEMKTTANMGIVEDVMSSVKTLPGVSYAGGWNAQPSIRGGYPEEMAASLDGFYVTYPFHWGGANSIFNPNMVESARLSHGIYSARYGRALSGILEITTKKPDEPEARVDGSLSTTSADLFVQMPTGESSGLFLGGKVTYLDTARLLFAEEMKDIETIPYIRDCYGKWEYTPDSAVRLYFNGFLGSDGVGFDGTTSAEEDSFTSEVRFDYDYINSFLAGGVEWAPSDTLFIEFLAGYNWNDMDMEFRLRDNGTKEYSAEFLALYGAGLGLTQGDTYTIDGLGMTGHNNTEIRQGQVKLAMEKFLDRGNVITVGTEHVLKQTSRSSAYSGWYNTYDEVTDSFELSYDSFTNGISVNSIWNPAVYLIWEKGEEDSLLKSEIGLRGEHYYVWNGEERMHAQPTASPRATLTWTVLENADSIDSLNLTLGSGVFSYFPLTADMLRDELSADDWTMPPDRALFNIVGAELNGRKGWHLTADAYYKYYLNRLVITQDKGDMGSDLYFNTNGKGHVLGFDMMLQKRRGKKWDGYLTYSFIYARYFTPSLRGDGTEEAALVNDDPLDQWFFPYYHRFHSLNLVMNWHFQPGWTFTVQGSLASGAPRAQVGDISVYPADYGGSVIEQYARTSEYSDSMRDGLSAPVNLRLSYGRYGKNRKLYTEWYVAVEDIFVNLYKPETNTSFNTNTGEENRDTAADFNIGVPIPSFGIKVSY